MGRFDKKEPKLNEVKAVLQRLQGFPDDVPTIVVKRPSAPSRRPLGGSIVAAIIFVPAAAILVAVYLFTSLGPSEPQKVEEKADAPKVEIKSEAVRGALEAARALMAKGQVKAAREQLLALAWKGVPDAAWDVARTYDPNALASLSDPDAAPDIAEATRWYRKWYDAGVKEGAVTATKESVERIIRAMQH